MKVITIEFGQVTWIVDLAIPSGKLYFPEAVTAIQTRYKFVNAPSMDMILSQRPNIIFEHGKFGDAIIRKFSTHTDGMVVETSAGTKHAEEFLDDFVKWASEELSATVLNINDIYRIYDSHLVVQMNINLDEKMEFVKFISNELSSYIKDYEVVPLDYHVSGFSLSTDLSTTHGPSTSPFRIDRRDGQRLSNNLYYCTAPLKTADHIRVLEKIDNLI